jgi:hypothetical protein
MVKFTRIFDARLPGYLNASSDFEKKGVERLTPNNLLITLAEAAVGLMSASCSEGAVFNSRPGDRLL